MANPRFESPTMATQVHEPSTRARGYGEFLKLWESNAPLTDDEVQLCGRVENECGTFGIPLSSTISTNTTSTIRSAGPQSKDTTASSTGTDPTKATSGRQDQQQRHQQAPPPSSSPLVQSSSGGSSSSYKGHDGLKGLADVTTAEEFNAWHDEMERRLQDANDEKYRTLIGELNDDRQTVQRLRGLISDAQHAVSAMTEGQKYVGDIVTVFKSDCENMVSERKKMGELADALRKRLTYFEELETLTTKLTGKDAIQPTHPDFVKLLHRLDECVAYASSSTGAVAEADGYLARFLDLQRRAFTLIRDYTVSTLRATAATVAKELRDDRLSGAGFRHADLTDASKEYLRFRTIAPRIKSLMSELRARASLVSSTTLGVNTVTGGAAAYHNYVNGNQAQQLGAAGTLKSARMVAGVVAAGAAKIVAGPRAAIADPFSNPASTTAPRSASAAHSSMSARSAATALYADCEECFFEERKRLLEPSVAAHIKSLGDVRNMIALARLGSAYVLRVCQLERQLYEHLFPVEKMESLTDGTADGDVVTMFNSKNSTGTNRRLSASMSPSFNNSNSAGAPPRSGDENPTLLLALRALCDMVYTELRPQIVHEDDLDKLVYLIEVLKTEILGDEVPRRGFAGKAFAPSAVRAIADAQERIIYRAEVFMRDEIRGFVPKPEQLDYPNRIIHAAALAKSGGSGKKPMTPEALRKKRASGSGLSSGNDVRAVGIYATWYPPVERTLRLLSMLYRCVEGEVFAGVAQEAVAMCVQCVGSAAARIASRQGDDHAEDHAQLFLVWQLLMTREQISPFDVEMSYTEHELDFLELRALLGSVMRGRVSARALASRPTIRERVVDSKRDLDQSVRSACEAFILKTTRTLLDPLMSFVAKCNALPSDKEESDRRLKSSAMGKATVVEDDIVKVERSVNEPPPTPPSTNAPFDSLKKNVGSFAHPKRITEMWAKVEQAVNTQLPDVVDRMKIYITKAASRGVLLRPIRANIAEAATELLSVLQLRYTLEERDLIGIDGAVVGKMLDQVDTIMGVGSSTSTTTQ